MQPATVRNYSDLIRLLCARRDELNLCHETLDALAGLQNGYASKILTPHHLRKLGPVSWSLVEALGLAVTIAEAPEALARMRRHHAWRERRGGRRPRPWRTAALASCDISIRKASVPGFLLNGLSLSRLISCRS
jgi:hypothetical protein